MSSKVLNESTNGHNMTNGSGKFIENIDPEDPQYRRELQRPADVKEDMRQMESRQRVSSILNSQAFREELESIIADQLKHGPHHASLVALQTISELLLPNTNSRWQQVSSMGKGNINITCMLTRFYAVVACRFPSLCFYSFNCLLLLFKLETNQLLLLIICLVFAKSHLKPHLDSNR